MDGCGHVEKCFQTQQNILSPLSADKVGVLFVCCLFVRDEPTKLDYDVLLALNVNEEPLDSTTYPCISTWLNLVHTFSEREQKK